MYLIGLVILTFVIVGISCDDFDNEIDPHTKIVGGEKSESIPYQISLQVKARKSAGFFNDIFSSNNGQQTSWIHICGGSIINKKYVVTAAHCVDKAKPQQLSIYSGSTNNKKGGQRHLVKKITMHEEYIELKQHDIALMEIEDEFEFDEKTAPITYDEEFIEAGENCLLTGWGYIYPIRVGDTPVDLQRVDLPVISNEECKKKYEDVSEREICTYRGALKGACGGDSGGPLVCKGKLHGVVSYGFMFCGSGLPDVFTRVAKYNDWIKKHISN